MWNLCGAARPPPKFRLLIWAGRIWKRAKSDHSEEICFSRAGIHRGGCKFTPMDFRGCFSIVSSRFSNKALKLEKSEFQIRGHFFFRVKISKFRTKNVQISNFLFLLGDTLGRSRGPRCAKTGVLPLKRFAFAFLNA